MHPCIRLAFLLYANKRWLQFLVHLHKSNPMKPKLPLGVQTFSEIREAHSHFAYVDKTRQALEAINTSKYIFLARPRRFGKSLLLDTFSELFKGSKELFEGLYVFDKWDWTQRHPVIKIDFSVGNYSTVDTLAKTLIHRLRSNRKHLGLPETSIVAELLGSAFQDLIAEAHQHYKQKVVVLIDEYDKPVIDNLQTDQLATARDARDLLRSFYAALKASDAHLRFVFMTGVSKFTQMSIFSGLNNLVDISINPSFSALTGYTQHELETVFAEHLVDVDTAELKRWYNGYNFLGEPVYNPYDVLLFFANGNQFDAYWWNTGGTKFLIDRLASGNYFLPQLQNTIVDKTTLNAFDIEHIELTSLLWQTGYLTFAGTETLMGITNYRLKVPNLEVQISLNALFYHYLTNLGGTRNKQNNATRMLLRSDFDALHHELKSLFAAIPHQNYVNTHLANYEGYYASVVYTFFSSLGFDLVAEDNTQTGRIDLAIRTPQSIVLLEFKVNQPAEAALHQIHSRRYYQKYLAEGKDIYLVGIQFSSTERNIRQFVWETFKP